MAIFTDPVAQAIITDPDSGDEWKWTAPDYPFLTGVTINYQRFKVGVFTLSFDIPYEYGIPMMGLPSPFKQGNLVKARIGYAGANAWTPWVAGFLKAGGDGLSIDSNGITGQISVQGVAESYGYTVNKDLLREAGWDPIKILELCARGMGLTPVISTGASADMNSYKLIGDRRGKAIRKQTFDFSSSLLSMSYWEVLKKICRDYNLTYWIGPDVGSTDPGRNLFVYNEAEASKGTDQDTAIRTYMIRGVIDEANLTYPCFAWSAEGSNVAAWLASQPDPAAHGVSGAYTDKATGEVVEEAVPPEEQPTAIWGVLADTSPTDAEVDGVKDDEAKSDGTQGTYTSAPVAPGAEDRFKKQLQNRQKQGNAAQQGTITSLGIIDERPGNICRLKGAGLIYDDTYQIDRMTHTYGPGSWEMTLVVKRFGRVLKVGEQKETSEGQAPA